MFCFTLPNGLVMDAPVGHHVHFQRTISGYQYSMCLYYPILLNNLIYIPVPLFLNCSPQRSSEQHLSWSTWADLASSARGGGGTCFPWGGARGSLTAHSPLQSAMLLSQHFAVLLRFALSFLKYISAFYHACMTGQLLQPQSFETWSGNSVNLKAVTMSCVFMLSRTALHRAHPLFQVY